ncbi:phospholipid/glycerol acyltransferase [Desulfatibacillum aliphaticivorans]|uniref:Phospholipid/glycerol acyltransferase n=1 Tax=Desulfatibacillum aliphaticivorans TaxID=218208 RepID=B8FBN1_DESAL|nr:lysophospholipid acyltransferase family protein [Desulfatibacillum aliphaticivorans]ACL04784.1 phospholipid/glycerol acyltransferase [Desulfatibacillum aliphaticivorans]
MPLKRDVFRPPLSAETMHLLQTLPRLYFNPLIFGLDNVDPSQPHLFVGNHTIYGVMDAPLYAVALYRETGVFPRGLGDRFHFKIPVWRRFLEKFGVVEGTPENCVRLMKAGDDILVYPGGGREVCRRKGEIHNLIWKERYGFARLAIKYGYPILPIASLGPDYAYSIFLDGGDVVKSRPGRLLSKIPGLLDLVREGEAIPPLARGLGLSVLPRPERFYCYFGRAIDTAPYKGFENDPKVLEEVRETAADAINEMMASLKKYRQSDPEVGLVRRILNKF